MTGAARAARAPRICGTPDAHLMLACDRPTKHHGQHAATVAGERVYWGRASGPSKSHAERQQAGLRRVEAWLSPEADAARAKLALRLGSTRAALEWALTQAAALL